MCSIIKVLLNLLIFFVLVFHEKSIADNIDVVDFQIIDIKFNVQNKQREKVVGINFLKTSKYRNINDKNSIYKDIMEHSHDVPFGDSGGRPTNAHETVHGINAQNRNEYFKQLGYRVNALYCLDGNILLVREPKITMRHVIPFVPEKLRSYRWNLYFVKQLPSWNERSTYILDEWVCYISGGKCAVGDYQNGIKVEKSDSVSGCLDFSIYAIALAMAVKTHDPEYWEQYPEFKETIKYFLIQAEKTLGEGLDIEEFNSTQQDILYKNLLQDPSSIDIRKFVISEFDGIFIK